MCPVLFRMMKKEWWTEHTLYLSSCVQSSVSRGINKKKVTQTTNNFIIILRRVLKKNWNALWALLTETILKTATSEGFFTSITYKLKLEEGEKWVLGDGILSQETLHLVGVDDVLSLFTVFS